jgi:REP-associated tyrosine transposase
MGCFMHWLLTTHAQRYRVRRDLSGHVWQGRYKSFPIQVDRHFLTVLRYVERNPVRAGLVGHATNWRWSSLRARVTEPGALTDALTASPVELPLPWEDIVDEPLTSAELARVRFSVRRGSPFGDAAWTRGAVERLGLESTTRPPGRPIRV